MNFTKTLPTKTGAYWHRSCIPDSGGADGSEHLIYVQMLRPGLAGNPTGERGLCVAIHRLGRDENIPIPDLLGEWCGPLVPVEEVAKAYREAWYDCVGTNEQLEQNFANSRARKIVQGELLP